MRSHAHATPLRKRSKNKRLTEHTRTVGYRTSRAAPMAHPHFTLVGKGSGNWPLLHFTIASNSVPIVARRSQQCCPIRTAFLKIRQITTVGSHLECIQHAIVEWGTTNLGLLTYCYNSRTAGRAHRNTPAKRAMTNGWSGSIQSKAWLLKADRTSENPGQLSNIKTSHTNLKHVP